MRNVNFMPAYRIVARQRRRRIRCWAVVMVAALVLELVGIACGYGLWCGGRMVLAKEEDRTAATIQSADRAIRMLQCELATKEATLKANQALEGQPDWSRLLSLLAQSLGEHLLETLIELSNTSPLEGKTEVEIQKGQIYNYLAVNPLREGKDFSWMSPAPLNPKLQEYTDSLEQIIRYMIKGEPLLSKFRLDLTDYFL